MKKVIRQNTVIRDYDNGSIFKVVSVGDGRNGSTRCIEYDFSGNLADDNTALLNREITNIVFKNYNAKAVFRPEENENLYYKVFIKWHTNAWKRGFDLQQLISDLAYEMLFEDGKVKEAKIDVGHYEKPGNWVTTYETKWITKDCVQEIDEYYSDPKHAYDTLEECIEELRKSNGLI